ncbi:protein LKAAEAR1-like isoform X2 [Dysidea avara]|uniref:protein LKAAEAR1-like isoform X2 n=1 Tax=Dysidea avara TaxID=196820 RepID=UPI003321FB5A
MENQATQGEGEVFHLPPINSTTTVSQKNLSKRLQYESPPKHIQELQEAALKRVRAVKQEEKEKVSKNPAISEVIEQEYNSELIGQLRAAEAKERVNNIRYQFRVDKAQEINHLISQQPSAMEAVRLKCFLQPQNPGLTANATVYLNQRQRERCEAILEDEKGLTVTRS